MGYKFEGFADWSDQELAVRSGLSITQSKLSRARLATEPISWNDTESQRLEFADQLGVLGIRMLRGGRFWHLMGALIRPMALPLLWSIIKNVSPIPIGLSSRSVIVPMILQCSKQRTLPLSFHTQMAHIFPRKHHVYYASFPASKGWNANPFTLRRIPRALLHLINYGRLSPTRTHYDPAPAE